MQYMKEFLGDQLKVTVCLQVFLPLSMDVYDAQCFLRGGKYDEKKYREFILHLRESLIQQNYIDLVIDLCCFPAL